MNGEPEGIEHARAGPKPTCRERRWETRSSETRDHRKPSRALTASAVPSGTVNLDDGVGFEMGVVGESYYGLEIERIAGDRLSRGEDVVFTATLRREPDNEYNPNAVAVIGRCGKKIGHLSRLRT
jgi:HIRAN domain